MEHQPVRQGQTTTLRSPCPTIYDKYVGSLTSPANHVTLKMQETGPTVYSPYPRKLEPLQRWSAMVSDSSHMVSDSSQSEDLVQRLSWHFEWEMIR